ncbi:MAG: hypothetical protein OXC19_11785 [Bryobacterales bacterium]|nr:hypothetical protein [Bryobacterales bacterium]
MLFEPRQVMEDLSRHPRWILPVALSQVPWAVLSVGAWIAASTSLQDEYPSGFLVRESGIAFLRLLASSLVGFLNQTAVLLLSSLILVGLIRARSRTLTVRHALAILSHSLVPGILADLVIRTFHAGVSILQFDLRLPRWFFLNVGTLLDRSTLHPLVHSIAFQIGVYPLWRWLLVALGLTIMVRPVSFRVAFGVAVVTLIPVELIWTLGWMSVLELAKSRLL